MCLVVCGLRIPSPYKRPRHPKNDSENVEFRRFLDDVSGSKPVTAVTLESNRVSSFSCISCMMLLMGKPPTPTHGIHFALGSRTYNNLNLRFAHIIIHMEPDICTVAALPPLIPIPPPHSCTLTCRHRPTRTITTHHLHLSCLSSHYSLKPSLGR